MTKRFCDRCGKEIKPTKIIHFPSKEERYITICDELGVFCGDKNTKYDLCHDCTVQLRKFLENKEVDIL